MDIERVDGSEFDDAPKRGPEPGPILTQLKALPVGEVVKIKNHNHKQYANHGTSCSDMNTAYVGAKRHGIVISIKHSRDNKDLLIKRTG